MEFVGAGALCQTANSAREGRPGTGHSGGAHRVVEARCGLPHRGWEPIFVRFQDTLEQEIPTEPGKDWRVKILLTNDDGSMTPRGQTIISHTPMGRYGAPEDLLGALLWLVDDGASGFVTGTVVAIDGGFNAFSGV